MSRTNTKTVSKFYDSDKVNDFDLGYEYESENNSVPAEVRVTGSNGKGGSFYFSRSGTSENFNFSGGASLDIKVVTEVAAEVAKILAGFEKKAAKA